LYGLISLEWLGELRELEERLPPLLKSADERGAVYEAVNLRMACVLHWLGLDEPGRARAEFTAIAATMERWSTTEVRGAGYETLAGLTATDLYVGDGQRAFARVPEMRRCVRRSVLSRYEAYRISAKYLWGSAALAAAADGCSEALGFASTTARSLARERAPWARGLASLVLGGVHIRSGDHASASRNLRHAVGELEASSMGLYAAVARRRLGELTGSDEGATRVAEADTWMRAHGVVNPHNMARMLAPCSAPA
jgi:hypothetical protein